MADKLYYNVALPQKFALMGLLDIGRFVSICSVLEIFAKSEAVAKRPPFTLEPNFTSVSCTDFVGILFSDIVIHAKSVLRSTPLIRSYFVA